MGYRRSMNDVSYSIPSSSSKSALQGSIQGTSTTRLVNGISPPVLAARALAIGSLISVSGFSLLISGVFYASGCDSTADLISTWRRWAPNKLCEAENSLENIFGISVGKGRQTAKAKYEQATKGMTEAEELEYIKTEIQADTDLEAADFATK